MIIMLSKEERERFAAWLEQDAAGTDGLLQQMAKLPNTEAIAKVKRAESMAQKIVAKMLRSIEGMEIR